MRLQTHVAYLHFPSAIYLAKVLAMTSGREKHEQDASSSFGSAAWQLGRMSWGTQVLGLSAPGVKIHTNGTVPEMVLSQTVNTVFRDSSRTSCVAHASALRFACFAHLK